MGNVMGGDSANLALLQRLEQLEQEIESLKNKLKTVNIAGVEITSNSKTVDGATEYIKWIFPDKTEAQLSANPSGMQLMTYDGTKWSNEWEIKTES